MIDRFFFPSPGKLSQQLQRQFRHFPSLWWGNGLVIALFMLLTLYVKFGGSDGSGWERAETVVQLFSEPFQRDHPFFGSLTKLSELLWCFSATVCVFSAMLIQPLPGYRQTQRFLWASAWVILALLVDDIFRFTLIAKLYLGIPKVLSYGVYGLMAIVYALVFRRILLHTPYLFLLIALAMFAISGITEVLPIAGMGTPAMLEDGTKLLGLVNIALYFWMFCRRKISRITQIDPVMKKSQEEHFSP